MFHSFDLKSFGIYLSNLRNSLHLTQRDIQHKTGISIDTLRRIENGKVVPRFDTLVYLSDVLKRDILKDFCTYSNSNKLMSFYDAIDNLIIEYNAEQLNELKLLIANESLENTLLIKGQRKQLILVVEGIYMINFDMIDDSLSLLYEAIKISLPFFELNNFKLFKYSVFETRILMLIALALEELDEFEDSLSILLYCHENLQTLQIMCEKDKLLFSKLCFNISYSYHRQDLHNSALLFANEGIKFCIDNFLNYALPGLLFRKGVAEFHLKIANYHISLEKSIELLKILNKEKLASLYSEAYKEKYFTL